MKFPTKQERFAQITTALAENLFSGKTAQLDGLFLLCNTNILDAEKTGDYVFEFDHGNLPLRVEISIWFNSIATVPVDKEVIEYSTVSVQLSYTMPKANRHLTKILGVASEVVEKLNDEFSGIVQHVVQTEENIAKAYQDLYQMMLVVKHVKGADIKLPKGAKVKSGKVWFSERLYEVNDYGSEGGRVLDVTDNRD